MTQPTATTQPSATQPAASKPATIVGVGEVLWDLLPSGKQLGGAPANFAYMANVLGDRGVVASRVGADALGREARHAMDTLGITTCYVEEDSFRPTGTVEVRVDAAGQPEFTIAESVAWDALEWTPQWAELASKADVLCYGSLAQRAPASRATIRRFLEAAPLATLRVYDVNLRHTFFTRDVLHESLQLAHVVKLNDQELPRIADLLASEVLLKKSARNGCCRPTICAWSALRAVSAAACWLQTGKALPTQASKSKSPMRSEPVTLLPPAWPTIFSAALPSTKSTKMPIA